MGVRSVLFTVTAVAAACYHSTVTVYETDSNTLPVENDISTSAALTTNAEFVPTTTENTPPLPSAPSLGSSGLVVPGIDAELPSGIDCSHFPSDYGAVRAEWLSLGGWIGLQMTPNYKPGDISAANSFCSYACPAGYQKSQWPTAQGDIGQSIGGLYCNSNGKLELSNPELSKKLCITGTGEVKVKNTTGKNIPICRTDYPGTESETVPLDTQPNQEYELTCPDANKYFHWRGAATSAQYYINPSGTSVGDACRWNEVNLGVGKGSTGETYISMFQNAPTNPDGKLDYNIEIIGDVSSKCEYRRGTFYNNGAASPSGCTVLVTVLPSLFALRAGSGSNSNLNSGSEPEAGSEPERAAARDKYDKL
ncbi:hypothetical protein VE03_10508, partial [Pseudogymnoascus sp. 23342-1-I1]